MQKRNGAAQVEICRRRYANATQHVQIQMSASLEITAGSFRAGSLTVNDVSATPRKLPQQLITLTGERMFRAVARAVQPPNRARCVRRGQGVQHRQHGSYPD